MATAGSDSLNADAPPGFEHVAPGTHSVGGISDGFANIQVGIIYQKIPGFRAVVMTWLRAIHTVACGR